MLRRITITGRLVSGLREGSYYMGQSGYKRQFAKKLGIRTYDGTLNLKLSKSNSAKLESARRKRRAVLVRGFYRGKKFFGDVLCYKAEVSSLKCAVVIPKLSKHRDVAELIAQERLRDKLRLKDGDTVTFTV